MFNVLLDELPEEYKGFRMNTDFRIGIMMMQAFNDPELTTLEQYATAADLLFGGCNDTLPDAQTAVQGIQYFLSGWYTDNDVKSGEKKPAMDYDMDQWRIFSAFLMEYKINLNTEKLHYWVFMALLTTLNECAFTNVVDFRMKKIDPKMKPEARHQMAEAKARYEIKEQETVTEKEEARKVREEFLAKTTIHKHEGK